MPTYTPDEILQKVRSRYPHMKDVPDAQILDDLSRSRPDIKIQAPVPSIPPAKAPVSSIPPNQQPKLAAEEYSPMQAAWDATKGVATTAWHALPTAFIANRDADRGWHSPAIDAVMNPTNTTQQLTGVQGKAGKLGLSMAETAIPGISQAFSLFDAISGYGPQVERGRQKASKLSGTAKTVAEAGKYVPLVGSDIVDAMGGDAAAGGRLVGMLAPGVKGVRQQYGKTTVKAGQKMQTKGQQMKSKAATSMAADIGDIDAESAGPPMQTMQAVGERAIKEVPVMTTRSKASPLARGKMQAAGAQADALAAQHAQASGNTVVQSMLKNQHIPLPKLGARLFELVDPKTEWGPNSYGQVPGKQNQWYVKGVNEIQAAVDKLGGGSPFIDRSALIREVLGQMQAVKAEAGKKSVDLAKSGRTVAADQSVHINQGKVDAVNALLAEIDEFDPDAGAKIREAGDWAGMEGLSQAARQSRTAQQAQNLAFRQSVIPALLASASGPLVLGGIVGGAQGLTLAGMASGALAAGMAGAHSLPWALMKNKARYGIGSALDEGGRIVQSVGNPVMPGQPPTEPPTPRGGFNPPNAPSGQSPTPSLPVGQLPSGSTWYSGQAGGTQSPAPPVAPPPAPGGSRHSSMHAGGPTGAPPNWPSSFGRRAGMDVEAIVDDFESRYFDAPEIINDMEQQYFNRAEVALPPPLPPGMALPPGMIEMPPSSLMERQPGPIPAPSSSLSNRPALPPVPDEFGPAAPFNMPPSPTPPPKKPAPKKPEAKKTAAKKPADKPTAKKPAAPAKKKIDNPPAPVAAVDPVDDMISQLNPSGNPVSVHHLRVALSDKYPNKADFDKAVIDMANAGKLELQKHPAPKVLTAAERDALISDGKGGYYNLAKSKSGAKPTPPPASADPISVAVTKLNPQAESGAVVALDRLREELKDVYPNKLDFDRAVLAAVNQGRLELQSHPGASALTAAQKEALIPNDRGGYYNLAGLKGNKKKVGSEPPAPVKKVDDDEPLTDLSEDPRYKFTRFAKAVESTPEGELPLPIPRYRKAYVKGSSQPRDVGELDFVYIDEITGEEKVAPIPIPPEFEEAFDKAINNRIISFLENYSHSKDKAVRDRIEAAKATYTTDEPKLYKGWTSYVAEQRGKYLWEMEDEIGARYGAEAQNIWDEAIRARANQITNSIVSGIPQPSPRRQHPPKLLSDDIRKLEDSIYDDDFVNTPDASSWDDINIPEDDF